jgi:hypothetical protein
MWRVSQKPKRRLSRYGYRIVDPKTHRIIPAKKRRAALRRTIAKIPSKRIGNRMISGRGRTILRLNAIRNYRARTRGRVYDALSADIRYLQSLA